MKLIKMKINRTYNPSTGVTHYEYPIGYDAQKIKFGPIYEDGENQNVHNVVNRGLNDCYIVFGVDNSDVSVFLSQDKSIKNGFVYSSEEITKSNAEILCSNWLTKKEIVKNVKAVCLACAKAARGIALTETDIKVLDPNDSTLGINMTPDIKDLLNNIIVE